MNNYTRVLLATTRLQLLRLAKAWVGRLIDLLMPSAVAFIPVILSQAWRR